MISLAVHEVEIMALIGNLAANISRAIENGAAREPAAAKPMLQSAAIRMHALASALPDLPPEAAAAAGAAESGSQAPLPRKSDQPAAASQPSQPSQAESPA